MFASTLNPPERPVFTSAALQQSNGAATTTVLKPLEKSVFTFAAPQQSKGKDQGQQSSTSTVTPPVNCPPVTPVATSLLSSESLHAKRHRKLIDQLIACG